jgi:hypothetical protein
MLATSRRGIPPGSPDDVGDDRRLRHTPERRLSPWTIMGDVIQRLDEDEPQWVDFRTILNALYRQKVREAERDNEHSKDPHQ